ncbi:hypothetical protein EBT25_03075 [bacterium]|nr:hypothetical protein [bacterium]
MARAAVSKKLTQKPKTVRPKLTRSAVKSIDDKYYGSEPIDISKVGYTNALNWYNYMYEQDQAREWLLEYLKKNKTKSELAAVRRLPKYAIPSTVGWIARILMNGNKLESLNYFEKRTAELIQNGLKTKEVSEVKVDKPVVSIQERTQAKINQLITECEEAIDNDSELNIYEWLKGKEATVQAANAIREFYSGWVDDFEPDEFDSRAQKKAKAEQKKYWEAFLIDCDRYVGNKKVTKVRKPREKKTKSAVDQVSKMKYQKEFPALKIVSVNPAEIVGCKQLWTYNTKYKKLTRYDAGGPNGIQVKGTTLTGYDVETSSTKSVRKPDIVIQSLLGAGKVALRTFIEDIKTNETKPNGRINNDTVLLRVIK